MNLNIGDTLFRARTQSTEHWVTCPHCFGTKALTVILGDNSQVSIDCAGCASGYNPPTGAVMTYRFEAVVETVTITVIERRDCGTLEYNHVPASHYFTTREAAVRHAAELVAQYEAEQQRKFAHRKEHEHKQWSWNATYHRNQLKKAQADVLYHTAKLNVAKVKAKEEKAES